MAKLRFVISAFIHNDPADWPPIVFDFIKQMLILSKHGRFPNLRDSQGEQTREVHLVNPYRNYVLMVASKIVRNTCTLPRFWPPPKERTGPSGGNYRSETSILEDGVKTARVSLVARATPVSNAHTMGNAGKCYANAFFRCLLIAHSSTTDFSFGANHLSLRLVQFARLFSSLLEIFFKDVPASANQSAWRVRRTTTGRYGAAGFHLLELQLTACSEDTPLPILNRQRSRMLKHDNKVYVCTSGESGLCRNQSP